ncbi:MAG: sulfatase-like hydrolase/transferase [Actinomycetota bacterium]
MCAGRRHTYTRPFAEASWGVGRVVAGTNFPRAFDTTPLCCPSRASVFTGQYTHNHGVRDTVSAELMDQSTTVQRYLRESGYRTAIAGKYLNHWDMAVPPPHFDRWAVFSGDPGKDGHYQEDWNLDGSRRTLPGYTTTIITKKSLRFLDDFEGDDDRPWLFVFPYAPHPPFEAEPKYRKASPPRWSGNPAVFEKRLGDKPPWLRLRAKSPAEGRKARTGQFRTLLSVDDMVGSIFGKLNELGEARSTMAFYLSDNGFMWGEHGIVNKRHPYLPSVRTPSSCAGPERSREGRRIEGWWRT